MTLVARADGDADQPDGGGKSHFVLGAHRLVLASASDVFMDLFASNAHNPVIFLPTVSASDLRAVLDYVYLGAVKVAERDVQRFLGACRDLGIRGHERIGPEHVAKELVAVGTAREKPASPKRKRPSEEDTRDDVTEIPENNQTRAIKEAQEDTEVQVMPGAQSIKSVFF